MAELRSSARGSSDPENEYTLFTDVRSFYENLLAALPLARSEITMLYFSFVHGDWAERIAGALEERAAAGVRVRLLIDQVGQVVDEPRRGVENQLLVEALRQAGVQVNRFDPDARRLSKDNRLHAKICAIDGTTAFIGGSNIGDEYTEMEDINLRIDGALGRRLHEIHDYFNSFSQTGENEEPADFHLSELTLGDAHIWLTVPRRRRDIRRMLLRLILDARREIHIRNWYFLPDQEILDALRSQAERGVRVRVLFSHRTKVRVVDAANHIHAHKLAQSGGLVYRYDNDYAHGKVAWNDRGEIVIGSANIDKQALQDNFECNLAFVDPGLAEKLRTHFEADAAKSLLQDEAYFRNMPVTAKAIAYLCSLAAPWL